MARYRDADLRGVHVVTRSGEKVGKLMAFELDADSHEVAQYVVARASVLAAFMPTELLVHPSQVVSLDNELMVIDDALLAERAEARAIAEHAATAQPASTMEG